MAYYGVKVTFTDKNRQIFTYVFGGRFSCPWWQICRLNCICSARNFKSEGQLTKFWHQVIIYIIPLVRTLRFVLVIFSETAKGEVWGEPSLHAFLKQRKAIISFVMSVCPRRITRLPPDGLPWNLVFENFFKFCWETLHLFKIRQK